LNTTVEIIADLHDVRPL